MSTIWMAQADWGADLSRTDVDAPWLMVLESVLDATHLKIEAEGRWKVTSSVLPDCGPDGIANFAMPDDKLLVRGCRFAALIGKIGGSSADHRTVAEPAALPEAGQPFAVGARCIVRPPTDCWGPLFLGFNAHQRPIHVESLMVRIWTAQLA